jgi:hypothetical protein
MTTPEVMFWVEWALSVTPAVWGYLTVLKPLKPLKPAMRAGKRQLMVEEAERFVVFCLTCAVCAPETVASWTVCMVISFVSRALWRCRALQISYCLTWL